MAAPPFFQYTSGPGLVSSPHVSGRKDGRCGLAPLFFSFSPEALFLLARARSRWRASAPNTPFLPRRSRRASNVDSFFSFFFRVLTFVDFQFSLLCLFSRFLFSLFPTRDRTKKHVPFPPSAGISKSWLDVLFRIWSVGVVAVIELGVSFFLLPTFFPSGLGQVCLQRLPPSLLL